MSCAAPPRRLRDGRLTRTEPVCAGTAQTRLRRPPLLWPAAGPCGTACWRTPASPLSRARPASRASRALPAQSGALPASPIETVTARATDRRPISLRPRRAGQAPLPRGRLGRRHPPRARPGGPPAPGERRPGDDARQAFLPLAQTVSLVFWPPPRPPPLPRPPHRSASAAPAPARLASPPSPPPPSSSSPWRSGLPSPCPRSSRRSPRRRRREPARPRHLRPRPAPGPRRAHRPVDRRGRARSRRAAVSWSGLVGDCAVHGARLAAPGGGGRGAPAGVAGRWSAGPGGASRVSSAEERGAGDARLRSGFRRDAPRDSPAGWASCGSSRPCASGLVCGTARQLSGSVAAPLGLHVVYNLLAIAQSRGWLVSEAFPKRYGIPMLAVWIAGVCVVAAVGAVLGGGGERVMSPPGDAR